MRGGPAPRGEFGDPAIGPVVDELVNPVAPYFVDPVFDREPIIRARILAVIDYIYRIQVK